MKEICKKQDCVGCSACFSSCNKAAISMQPDALGFLYPVIDQDKCVDCGLCAKSCFNNCKLIYNEPIETYVGHAINNNEQITSTSGGLASVFMRCIISFGGIVYGCSGENAHEVKHIRIESSEEVERLKGSKYVQSYMGHTYMNVLTDLKADRTVLFIGTPCQVAGLKAYLKGKIYGNLYTVDFVCHGVPSQQILDDAINAKVKDNANLRLVNRVKENDNKSKYTLRLLKNNHIVCDDTFPSKGYITGFLCGLYYRESCYQCQFARKERISDITLGDFWDCDDSIKDLLNKKDGLSMIMINTDVGKKLLSICGNSFAHITWNYEDFITRNKQLKKPFDRHPKGEQFQQIYLESGFEKAIRKTLTGNLLILKKNLFINRVKMFILKILVIRRHIDNN